MKAISAVFATLAIFIVLGACAPNRNELAPTKEPETSVPKIVGEVPRHFSLPSLELGLPSGWYGLDFSKDLEPQVQAFPISKEDKEKILELYSGFKSLGSMEFMALNMNSSDAKFVDNFNITIHAPVTGDFLTAVQGQVKSTYGSYAGYKVTQQPRMTKVQGLPAAEFGLSVNKDSGKLRAYSCIINTPTKWIQLTVVCREVVWTSMQADIGKIKDSFRLKTESK